MGGNHKFSFLTDSESESEEERAAAVEELLSQAADHAVLEQIAAINCSSFSPDHLNLPSHLESRFRTLKLKSLPPSSFQHFSDLIHSDPTTNRYLSDFISPPPSDDKTTPTYYSSTIPPPPPSSHHHLTSSSFSSPTTQHFPTTTTFISTSSHALSSDDDHSRTLSPVRRRSFPFCFCSSPNQKQKKKNKQKKKKEANPLSSSSSSSFSSSWGGFHENHLHFFKNTFSTKQQMNKIIRKAIKEEDNINREADKVVKWAKQASSRMMDVSPPPPVVDDDDDGELSDLQVEQHRRRR